MRLVIIAASGDPLASSFFDFGDALLASTWLTTVGAGYGLTHVVSPSVHVTGPAMAASVGYRALQQYVTDLLITRPELAPDGHTMYVVFYPPGTSFPNDCYFTGEHWALDGTSGTDAPTDGVAFVQRCGVSQGDTELDALTTIASHEIIEAISDASPPGGYAMPSSFTMVMNGGAPPWSVSPWSFSQTGSVENGDLCEGTRCHEGGTTYQRVWSNAAAMAGGDPCLPALDEPYYSVTTPSSWVEVPAGATTVVPVVGWSTGARRDWFVSVGSTSWTGRFTASFGTAQSVRINDGRSSGLSITAPMVPGQFAVFHLYSSPMGYVTTASGQQLPVPASGDVFHDFVFGVHSTCSSGCTAQPATCGDGHCDGPMTESCANCPDDCGVCGGQCGASNFTSVCGATFCPAHARCVAGACVCDTGFSSTSCDGSACTGSGCAYPDYWCTPTSCGAANWQTPCGASTCPNDGQCLAAGRCGCPEGTQLSTCDGQPCSSGACSYPNYWCAVCGANNFTVTCPTTRCPAFSACNPDGTCGCVAGYSARDCDGSYCNGANCPFPSWWCVADAF